MKTIKFKNHIEYLSKDILDEEFVKSLRVTYSFQTLMASSRVDIKDRFVTTPSIFQKCYTILNVISLLVVDFIIIQKSNLIPVESETIHYLSACAITLQTLTYLCNIIHVRFLNGDANVDFFVKLQQIDRCMKINRNKKITAMLVKMNIISLAWVLVIFSAVVTVASFKGSAFWSYLGIVYSQLSFIIELVWCSSIIMNFFIRARFMNSIIKNYIDRKKTQEILNTKMHPITSLFGTKKSMRRLAAETHNFVSSDTDVYLKEILGGFSKFQDICRFQVFMFCCKLVISSVITFQFLLFAVQNEAIGVWDSLTPSFFTMIDLLEAVNLGIRCEIFLREVRETKRLAIDVMALHFDGRIREKAKRMLKLIEETPPRFSVYDMWQLNANVLLKMFMLVTSFVVTQLQFAFL